MKDLRFRGDSRKVISKFPTGVREDLAHQVEKIRSGTDPSHIMPMPSVGAGVIEIKIKDRAGEFRVFYVAKFMEAVYILHAFQKKTRKTSPKDLQKGRKRYKELIAERKRK